jgi:uncharacterized protein (TIGR02246 family)
MNTDEQAITGIVTNYQQALNRSDTDALVKLYTNDGVFMPEYSPSSVGADAVRSAYRKVFEKIALDLEFDVAEVNQVAPDWAFARASSHGTVKEKATGKSAVEESQELIVFQKVEGQWKIARYGFWSAKPPSA